MEATIQRHLIRWLMTLSFSDPIAWASNNNEYARHAVDMGVEVGSPDLTLRQKRGDITHFLYLELKTQKGKLSPAQKKWNNDFDAHYASSNCTRAVAYGFNDAKDIILRWLEPVE